MGNASFTTNIPVKVVLGCSHPTLRKWLKSGRLIDAEIAERHDTSDYSILVTIKNGAVHKKIAIPLPSIQRSGSATDRAINMVDTIKEAITDEVIAKIALSI